MKMHARAIFQWPRRSEKSDTRIQALGWLENAGRPEDHPALNLFAFDAGQIHSGSLTGERASHCSAARMQSANANRFAQRIQFRFILSLQRAGDERTRYDRAEAFHRKCAINRQAKVLRGIFCRHGFGDAQQFFLKGVKADACGRADGHNGRTFQE